LNGGVPISGAVAGRPFESNGGYDSSDLAFMQMSRVRSYLLLWDLSGGLDTVSALDHVCFETYRSGPTVQFKEQAAGIAKNRASLISSP
jgi:hypothetical protein